MQIRDKLYIDGRWTAASRRKTIDVHNTSTEEIMGRIPEGDYTDVQAAVSAARRAFDGWAAAKK
ncbi:MAG: aldehyde dehydrogenase family protein [Betaproteobacteria bacterium]|nr:aldehyde dehydrogenase family protein [Betaproteobacteria bacterium]